MNTAPTENIKKKATRANATTWKNVNMLPSLFYETYMRLCAHSPRLEQLWYQVYKLGEAYVVYKSGNFKDNLEIVYEMTGVDFSKINPDDLAWLQNVLRMFAIIARKKCQKMCDFTNGIIDISYFSDAEAPEKIEFDSKAEVASIMHDTIWDMKNCIELRLTKEELEDEILMFKKLFEPASIISQDGDGQNTCMLQLNALKAMLYNAHLHAENPDEWERLEEQRFDIEYQRQVIRDSLNKCKSSTKSYNAERKAINLESYHPSVVAMVKMFVEDVEEYNDSPFSIYFSEEAAQMVLDFYERHGLCFAPESFGTKDDRSKRGQTVHVYLEMKLRRGDEQLNLRYYPHLRQVTLDKDLF
jgi:hypothetical protein